MAHRLLVVTVLVCATCLEPSFLLGADGCIQEADQHATKVATSWHHTVPMLFKHVLGLVLGQRLEQATKLQDLYPNGSPQDGANVGKGICFSTAPVCSAGDGQLPMVVEQAQKQFVQSRTLCTLHPGIFSYVLPYASSVEKGSTRQRSCRDGPEMAGGIGQCFIASSSHLDIPKYSAVRA